MMAPLTSGIYSSATGTFSIHPTLPDGLTIDGVTGDIKGKPSMSSEMWQYEVTFTVQSGSGENQSGCSLLTQYRFNLEVLTDNVIICDGGSANKLQCQVWSSNSWCISFPFK